MMVFIEDNIGAMGLALSYGMALVGTFQYTAQMTAEAESLVRLLSI